MRCALVPHDAWPSTPPERRVQSTAPSRKTRVCGNCRPHWWVFTGLACWKRSRVRSARLRRSVSDFEGFPHSLDYGLYFFGAGNVCEKYRPGEPNAYFLDDRDVLIYVHGWEVDRLRQKYRETFHWKSNEPRFGLDFDLALPWLTRRWNVGIFYWDMFSDEDWLPDAEAKIWTAEGPRRMRYRTASGDFKASSISQSCADLLASQLQQLPLKSSRKLRLAGHSLGSPLVIAAAAQAFAAGSAAGSLRIALLDPYWSRRVPLVNPQSYMRRPATRTTAQESLDLAMLLAEQDVPFEIYYSCPMMTQLPLVADDLPARRLVSARRAAVVHYDASYQGLDFEAQHLLAPNLYLHSMKMRHIYLFRVLRLCLALLAVKVCWMPYDGWRIAFAFLPPRHWPTMLAAAPGPAPKVRVGPSVLAGDLSMLAKETRRVLRAGADFVHLDVFDGNWVKGAFTFGPMVVKALRAHEPSAYLDVHLCVTQPAQYLEELAKAGASRVLLHFEALGSVHVAKAAAQLAHQLGLEVGLALAPQTSVSREVLEAAEGFDVVLCMTVPPGFGGQAFMPEVLPKLRELRETFPGKSLEVDGGVTVRTAALAAAAGANEAVAGSAVFGAKDLRKSIRELRNSLQQ
ncbi:unnamed protein product [Durusdinium trenchii]|uniref:Ribulose-phosphate 3-epimerase (Pentose-5-phosphate 3-epimerase) (PPE) (RPE) n=2 Tax=Durusdinium trenchii TaxID=1381693 RepID=A0ABP0R1B0_9DINO